MTKQDVYFWQIQWAGRWMVTHTRFSEEDIKREHPEAVCIQESREERLVPETPMEKVFSHFKQLSQASHRGTQCRVEQRLAATAWPDAKIGL